MQDDNRPLRIALDRRAIGWGQGTGVARYRAGLAAAAARIGMVEPIGDGVARPAWADLPRIARGRVALRRDGAGWRADDLYRLAQRHFSLTGRLLDIAAADPPDLVHWSHPMPLRLAGAANICTVHDLIPLEAPGLTGMSGARQDRMLRRLADGGMRFATVSETVRSALVARYDLDPGRVACCWQAVEPGPQGELPAGLVPGGYLLALGRVESRKNVERLLLAHRASGIALPLVIAGPEGDWASDAERRRVEALAGAPAVIRLGWQSDDVAMALVARARALLMPSLAEGFGLPAIEAMALGVPAMVADRGAAAEVAGDGALMVDPLDTAAIAAAIVRIDRDEALRDALIARGRARAATFGMETFAARLRALYGGFRQGGFEPA